MPSAQQRYWKTRRFWWLRPAILGPAIGLILVCIPMAWWISTYGDMVAVGMFVLTYLMLLVFVIIMMRRSLLDTVQKVNTGAVRSVRTEVEEERLRKRREMIARDLEAVKQGHPVAVLDIWRLDERLRDRHPFFRMIAASTLDPAARELHLRIHLTQPEAAAMISRQPRELLRDVTDFLHLIVPDAYFRTLRPFADELVLEIDRMVDDGSFHGSPAPVFSLHARYPDLDRFVATKGAGALPGYVRFNEGAPIEPHRCIAIRETPGTK